MARKGPVVNSQMGGKIPSMKPGNRTFDHNPSPPFTRKHDVGNGGIPVVFEESMGGKRPAGRTVMATKNPAFTAPSKQGKA